MLTNIFKKLFSKTTDGQIKFFINGLCKVMVVSASAARRKYPGKQYYSDYAILALSTRPRWNQIAENKFIFQHGGEIEISPEDSLLIVIRKVAIIELKHSFQDYDPLTQGEYVSIGLEEINKFFKKK